MARARRRVPAGPGGVGLGLGHSPHTHTLAQTPSASLPPSLDAAAIIPVPWCLQRQARVTVKCARLPLSRWAAIPEHRND